MVEKLVRDGNDQTEMKEENEERIRVERLVRASLLRCFFGKLVSCFVRLADVKKNFFLILRILQTRKWCYNSRKTSHMLRAYSSWQIIAQNIRCMLTDDSINNWWIAFHPKNEVIAPAWKVEGDWINPIQTLRIFTQFCVKKSARHAMMGSIYYSDLTHASFIQF